MESNKSFQTKEHRARIVEAIMKGYATGELIELVKLYSPVQLPNKDILKQIDSAKAHLEEITELDTQKIISIHLGWYEEMYRYFEEIKHVEGMNKVMKAKERLLGLHKRENKVVINNKNTVNVTRKVEYDFSRLSEPQKIRLQELMDKMK